MTPYSQVLYKIQIIVHRLLNTITHNSAHLHTQQTGYGGFNSPNVTKPIAELRRKIPKLPAEKFEIPTLLNAHMEAPAETR
jgi:hypothetical protein